jgi:acyl-CoA synthetase (AMP-forming)/AMP-acid ligase II
VLEEMEEKYKCTVIEAYAMTETAYQITSNPITSGSAKRRPGTVGFPHGSVEIIICDSNGREKISGEICVRGPNVIRQYLNNPEADSASFFPNGFFRTGDLGFIDPQDGYLTITGRLKEQINRGGEKISPFEIEQVARMHANITDAVAFGIPDRKYGEVIGLAVVMKKEDAISEKEVREFLKTRLANFKIPSRIWIADSPFPRTRGTGKLQRSLLASHFIEKIS